MSWIPVLQNLAVGLFSGFSSGWLGVSPGGGLVVFSSLVLGAGQHLAQGISLVGQIPPTSVTGARQYHKGGNRFPAKWLALISFGFLIASAFGALTAAHLSNTFLRWGFVSYLLSLLAFLFVKGRANRKQPAQAPAPRWHELLAVGLIAGFSSGLLGIGGGLAITVCLTAWLKLPQLQAAMISVYFSILPMSFPAALVYIRNGSTLAWPAMAEIMIGLLLGVDLGARLANRMGERKLRNALAIYILFLAMYVGRQAIKETLSLP